MMALHAARVLRQRHKAESEGLETEISNEQRKVLEEAFEAADKNGDGILSADEYYDIFQTHGLSIGKSLRPSSLISLLEACRTRALSYTS